MHKCLSGFAVRRAVVAAFLLMVVAGPVLAVTESPFGAYFHTGWTPSDGAPGDIHRIAQDADGWLWLGSAGGLYRFDGERFERMDAIDGNKLQKTSILSLAFIDGALWVGYDFGGVERFKDGVATYFDAASGLPPASVETIVKAPGGMVTAATASGLYEWNGKHWTLAWPAEETTSAYISGLRVGPDQALFFSSTLGGPHIYRRAAGAAHFEAVPSDDPAPALLDSALWAAGPSAGFMAYDAAARRFRRVAPLAATVHGHDLLVQRDGTAWMKMDGAGIALVKDTGSFLPAGTLGRNQGLSDDNIITQFEDRDGNLWLGTGGGLDRIRRNRAHAFAVPADTRAPGVLPDAQGALWVASLSAVRSAPLRLVGADGSAQEHGMEGVTVLMRGWHGDVWAMNDHQVARFGASGVTLWDGPSPGTLVQAAAEDRDGSLWLASSRGMRQLVDGKWIRRHELLGFYDTPILLHKDEQNRLWQTFTANRVAVLDGRAITRYTVKDGLRIGNVLSISTRGGHVWVGGEQGVMLQRGGAFVALTAQDGSDFLGVSGIVASASGDLWLHGVQGISHIAAAEVRRVLAGGAPQVAFERYDDKDGIVGQAPMLRPLPTLHEGGDGRIWYNTVSTVGWLDPAELQRGRREAPVRVRALVADGKRYAPASKQAVAQAAAPIALPAGIDNLRLDYTALAPTMPERLRFRYRLHGADAQWVTAGTRRSAYYTRLGPGDYQFEVQVASDGGAWRGAGASVDFSIAPTLTQTWWFRTLLAAAALAAVWQLHRWRLQRQARQIRRRMEARLDERGRIARELHDTLLQSVQGLILKVHGVAVRMPAQEPMRGMLDAALTQAEGTVAEGRQRVRDLRGDADGRDLVALLAAVSQELSDDAALRPVCTVSAVEAPRPLAPGVSAELYAIGREAMLNAFRHAHATRVTVEVAYLPKLLRLSVTDDGRGIPAAVMAHGGRDGHWGMAGMRERAARFDAELSLVSAEGGGTCCVVTIAAAQAYARPKRRRWRGCLRW